MKIDLQIKIVFSQSEFNNYFILNATLKIENKFVVVKIKNSESKLGSCNPKLIGFQNLNLVVGNLFRF